MGKTATPRKGDNNNNNYNNNIYKYIIYILYIYIYYIHSLFLLTPPALSHNPNCNCNNCNAVTPPLSDRTSRLPRNPLIPNAKIIFLKSLQKKAPLSPLLFWPCRTFGLPLLRQGPDTANRQPSTSNPQKPAEPHETPHRPLVRPAFRVQRKKNAPPLRRSPKKPYLCHALPRAAAPGRRTAGHGTAPHNPGD